MPPHKHLPSIVASRKFWLLLALFVLFFCHNSIAASPGVLDDINQSYKDATTNWLKNVEPIARSLFWKLAAIEFAWATIVWAMQQEHVQSFTVALTKKIIGIGFFYALLINAPDWMNAIVQSFRQTGETAAGVTSGLTPSLIFDRGIDIAAACIKAIHAKGLVDTVAAAILAGWTAICIVVAFAIVAAQLLIALVESYIVISAGILFLGFGGSRWTTDLAQKYIGYAVATGVKLFILFLIIGVAETQSRDWINLLATSSSKGTNFGLMFSMLGASIVLVFLAFQIPSTAAGMLSGAPSLTAGAAASTGAAVGAGVTAAGARALSPVASAAKGTLGGALGGAGKAWQAGTGYAAAAGSTLPAATGLGIAAKDWGREAANSVRGLSSGSGSIGSRAAAKRSAMTDQLKEQSAASAPPQSTAMTAAAEGKSAPSAGAVPQVSPPGAGGAGRAPDRLSGEGGLGSAAANPTALNVSASGKSAEGATHAAPASEAAGAVESRSLGAEKMRQAASGGTSGAGISEPSHAPDRLSGEGGLGSAQPNETAINVSDSNQAADTTHAAPAPEASAAPQFSSASASSGAPRQASPPSPQEQPQQPKQPGMFESVQQVRPPQIPSDAAPSATANFRTDLGGE